MDIGIVRNIHSKNKFEKLVHIFGFIIRNNISVLSVVIVTKSLKY